ncbi:MAG: aminodeoxychorismate synthase component I [PS1 clade bacterium]
MKILSIPCVQLDALCYSNPKRYPFLLESVTHNSVNRYSILFSHPGEEITLNDIDDFDFLSELESKVSSSLDTQQLPFTGGWFVYLSYELIGQIEPTIKTKLFSSGNVVAKAVKIPTAIVIDHTKDEAFLVDQDGSEERMSHVINDIDGLVKVPPAKLEGRLIAENEEKFLFGVNKTKEYIKAGDVFQVNLSREWQYELESRLSATQIYRTLKSSNPAPFAALAQFDEISIISSSPERLFSVTDGVVQTRPIAGTHPRGDGDEDELLKIRLMSHPKEQAEHVMLLDLERNDMGRVCRYGSVHVNETMVLETYPFVHHIVSNIKGEIEEGITVKDLVRALFPGGTITGCPKVRCMEIIAELEQMPRGAYTGSIGYISNDGKIDFNILIRSFVKEGKRLTFRAGAGIVYDSIPSRELDETKYKAEGLIRALNI